MTISARPIVPLPRLTYTDVEQKYGPQTKQIEDLLSYTINFTNHASKKLESMRDDVFASVLASVFAYAWDAARDTARNSAGATNTTWNAARDTTWNAAKSYPPYSVLSLVWAAAWDSVVALLARDRITPEGFTQEHYDTLTLSWRLSVGLLHPDDTQLTPKQCELGQLMLPTWKLTATELIETLIVLN